MRRILILLVALVLCIWLTALPQVSEAQVLPPEYLELPEDNSWKAPAEEGVFYRMEVPGDDGPPKVEKVRKPCRIGGKGVKCKRTFERPNKDTDWKLGFSGGYVKGGGGGIVKAEF